MAISECIYIDIYTGNHNKDDWISKHCIAPRRGIYVECLYTEVRARLTSDSTSGRLSNNTDVSSDGDLVH